MRFLIVSTVREAVTPDMALGMFQMAQAWVAEHQASGKMEEVWSFAGMPGGGGILNVDSHEELDSIMAGFPFGQVSNITVYPLADLEQSFETSIANVTAVLEAMGGG